MSPYTPIHSLSGRRIIALADADNLTISFRRFGLELNQTALRNRLAEPTLKLTAAAVLTTHPRMNYTTEAWRAGGWKVTAIMREIAWTCRGSELHANADFDLCFEAGALIESHPHADTFIFLSGDGNLATALARDVRRRRPKMAVFAAAVPGSASSRLRDAKIFTGFIPLGEDVTTNTSAMCA